MTREILVKTLNNAERQFLSVGNEEDGIYITALS